MANLLRYFPFEGPIASVSPDIFNTHPYTLLAGKDSKQLPPVTVISAATTCINDSFENYRLPAQWQHPGTLAARHRSVDLSRLSKELKSK